MMNESQNATTTNRILTNCPDPASGIAESMHLAKTPRHMAALARPMRLALRGVLAALLLWSSPAAAALQTAPVGSNAAQPRTDADEEPHSWLLKWRDSAQAKPLRGTRVLRRLALPSAAVDVVRPEDPGADAAAWLTRLRQTPGVEYVEPNSRVAVLSAPQANDPELPKQLYLDEIGVKEAWATVRSQTDLTIALVDTGVDLDHPDLKNNLVPGTNLVHPGTPPDDDNGHGTEVAGVLAGEADNKTGIAGILWHAKIMPVKALDSDGFGDEERLGEGIMYAVKNGAKIVVMSVGLYRYSSYLKDITDYAESKGVLLVAASGNDGMTLGSKAAVKYPAAYPTVLAVGGATPDGQPEPRSNRGPEIDLVAPWNVYTTAVGGGYKKEEGTSMSAPQAAAAAALAWAVHPDYKPYQIRALLRQSAKDIGAAGFDEAGGYGLLRVDKAVSQTLLPDAFEPNDNRSEAKLFPLGSKISAQLNGGADGDWFRIDAPYDGVLSIKFQGLVPSGESMPPVRMTQYEGPQAQSVQDMKLGSQTVTWNVKKGRNDFELRFYDEKANMTLPYLLTSSFTMAPDVYEPNDKPYEAFALLPRSQTVTGNFHQAGDEDWFIVKFATGGTLRLTVSVDTARIDPAIAIQREKAPLQDIDENGEGETEETPQFSVTPGTYYFEVRNAAAAKASPVAGEYKLRLDFLTQYTDPNEPNNKSYEATAVIPGSEYVGVIGSKDDSDWYQLRVAKKSVERLSVNGIPEGVRMKAELFDKQQQSLFAVGSIPGRSAMTGEKLLNPGVYYIKVTADVPFDRQYYKFSVDETPIVSGFQDIDGHWAEGEIAELAGKGIVVGSGSNRFEPNRGITRAEAAAMLVKAYKPAGAAAIRFTDVSDKHWAYDAIAKALHAGWVDGYPDGKFGPDRLITREEMAVLLSRAQKPDLPEKPAAPPFEDVKASRWSAGDIDALKKEGIIEGYSGGLFRPGQTASRAEFAAALVRTMNIGGQ